jgi:hypothetical protein
MKKEIKTEIIIHSTIEKVWTIITDFKAYPNWNPWILSLTGDVKVNNTITVKVPGMTFKPKVIAFENKKEIKWLGKLFFSGLFDGEHQLLLIDNNDGTITFKHNEKFNGILLGLLNTDKTKKGFQNMNQKLKSLAES